MKAIFLSLAAFLLLSLTTFPTLAQVTALKAARMLDVETGQVSESPVVLVEGDRIKAINPPQIPGSSEVVDLGNVTLLPGFMDMHTHLTYDLDDEFILRAVKETSADEAIRGVSNAHKTLMAGFTTVRNVGSRGFSDVALMEAIDEGLVPGPHIFPAAHSLSITGGHCESTGWAPGILEAGPEKGVADGVAEVLKAVRYQIKHGAKVIKICATAGVLSFEGPVGAQQYSLEEMKAITQEAHRHGVKVAAHAHGTEGIRAAVEAGINSIEHGSALDEETARLMKENGTYLVPTTYLADAIDLDILPSQIRAKAKYILPIARQRLRMAIQQGVPIAFGTDAAVFPHGHNAKEFATLVELGMTPGEALRTATLHAADLLGVKDRGVLKAEKLADIVAVSGNPLEDITVTEDVVFVMKAGKIYKRP